MEEHCMQVQYAFIVRPKQDGLAEPTRSRSSDCESSGSEITSHLGLGLSDRSSKPRSRPFDPNRSVSPLRSCLTLGPTSSGLVRLRSRRSWPPGAGHKRSLRFFDEIAQQSSHSAFRAPSPASPAIRSGGEHTFRTRAVYFWRGNVSCLQHQWRLSCTTIRSMPATTLNG